MAKEAVGAKTVAGGPGGIICHKGQYDLALPKVYHSHLQDSLYTIILRGFNCPSCH